LYRLYNRKLFYHLKRLTHSSDVAEELLQEVFLKVWIRREQLEPGLSFSSYIYRIAANLVYDLFRRTARDQKLYAHLVATGSELYDHIELQIDSKEQQQLMENAIASLPPQRQKIFRLCKVEGRSYEEVSKLLGISISTVNDHIVKASRTVKQQLFSSRETAMALLLAYLLNKK
jgi:RNA polymerase sigma-70 factor (family 1)